MLMIVLIIISRQTYFEIVASMAKRRIQNTSPISNRKPEPVDRPKSQSSPVQVTGKSYSAHNSNILIRIYIYIIYIYITTFLYYYFFDVSLFTL